MRLLTQYIILLFLIISCNTKDSTSRKLDLECDYKLLTYYGDTTDNKNLSHTEYYDKKGKLIRSTGNEEGCTRFVYDSSGHLTEKIWGRNCSYGIRELMIYDKSYNLLGTYRTRDSLMNLDTITYKQTKFYDTDNNLVKELDHEWNDSKGEKHERWNSYVYKNKKRVKELDVEDSVHLVWTGTYEYDSIDNLKAIKKVRGNVFRTETFIYDNDHRLVEKKIESNEHPLTPEVSFSASNNRTLYKYSASGQLFVRTTLSHKGKVDSKALFIRKQCD